MLPQKFAAVAVTSMALLVATFPVSAQNSPNVPGRLGLRGAAGQVKNKIEFEDIVKKKMEVLQKPVELPGVPQFTGNAKFMYGQITHGQKGNTGIAMRFTTNSAPQQVLDFYRQGLQAYKWNVDKSNNPHEVSASKAGETCRVTIYPRMGDGSTDFYISAQLRQH